MSIWQRWQAGRQYRREILEDLRVNGWRSASIWGQRVAGALRDRSAAVREFVAQAPEQARKAGQLVAAKVIGAQRSARLPEHLVERSARSVLGERRGPEPSAEWKQGYADVARAYVALPGLPESPEPPARPSWPHGPSREDPEAGG